MEQCQPVLMPEAALVFDAMMCPEDSTFSAVFPVQDPHDEQAIAILFQGGFLFVQLPFILIFLSPRLLMFSKLLNDLLCMLL